VRRAWLAGSVLLGGCSLSHERLQDGARTADAAVSGDAAFGKDAAVAIDAELDSASELAGNWEFCAQREVLPDAVTRQLPCAIEAQGVAPGHLSTYVKLGFTPQPGAPVQVLGLMESASACLDREDAYFVEGEDPASLHACPETCALWRASPNGRVHVYLACIHLLLE